MAKQFLAAGLTLSMLLASAANGLAQEAGRIAVSKRVCQRLIVEHQARDDVAYTAGVDARGRKVVPADTSGPSPVRVPDIIEFIVTQDLGAFTGKARKQSDAAQAAANAAAAAQEAANAAVEVAETASDVATQSLAAVLVEDAVAAVAAATEIRDAAQQKAADFPGNPPFVQQFDGAQAALIAAQTSLTAAQTAQAANDFTTATSEAASAVTSAASIGANVATANEVGSVAGEAAARAATIASTSAAVADASAVSEVKASGASAAAAASNAVAANAAVTAAEAAVQGASTIVATAQAAFDADPTNTALKVDLVNKVAARATTSAAVTAAQSAAENGDAATALSQAQIAVTTATGVGFAEDANFTALRTNADTLASAASQTRRLAATAATASAATDAAFKQVARSPEMNVNIGTVRFDLASGELTFNGQPLDDQQAAQLREACRRLSLQRR